MSERIKGRIEVDFGDGRGPISLESGLCTPLRQLTVPASASAVITGEFTHTVSTCCHCGDFNTVGRTGHCMHHFELHRARHRYHTRRERKYGQFLTWPDPEHTLAHGGGD